MERGWREISPNCPRCGSSNTKFCYYNNYSLTQPRYFCKGCRRYWTKGGSLRNVPVGGGCRKSRRSRSSSSLRLATTQSNSHHHHHHGLTPSRSSTIFGHHGNHIGVTSVDNNQLIGHHSSFDDDTMVESTPSSVNPEVPSIDLAAVYANFLNQKPESNDGIVVKIPDVMPIGYEAHQGIEFPSIPDATHIGPSPQAILQQRDQHTNTVDCISQGLSIPHLNNDNDHNHMFLTEFNKHVHHHEEISIQHELGLPPLPGEPPSWAPSSNNNHDHDDLHAPRLSDIEPESQFSNNFFIGSWSPLDFPGFETSSSSSKP